MLSLKSLLFGALAVSASVLPRDAASVQSSLETIDTDVNALTEAANNYNGGVFGAIPVQNAADVVQDDVDAATQTAQASNQLSSSESMAIIAYINNTLEPDVNAALTTFVNKKDEFPTLLQGTVRDTLDSLAESVQSLGTALINIASDDTKADGQAALDKINADFQVAQAAYA